MKHLKLFENFADIDTICKKYGITNYTINPDGTVDVGGNVSFYNRGLKDFPIKFGKIMGYFDCRHNELETLEGSPREVGDFYCDYNKLTTLEGGPNSVNGSFYCAYNQLSSLRGGPKEIDYDCDFHCNNNKLISLEFSPISVGGSFDCSDNKLISLDGSPKEVGGDYDCIGNPIDRIYILFGNYKQYQDSLDYNYLRGTDIVKLRFKEALEEIGVELPEKIEGYNYI